MLLDLIQEHPRLAEDDIARLKELFKWRTKKEQEWLKTILAK